MKKKGVFGDKDSVYIGGFSRCIRRRKKGDTMDFHFSITFTDGVRLRHEKEQCYADKIYWKARVAF